MHPLYSQASALTEEVIAAAVKVQKHFGIGGLESICNFGNEHLPHRGVKRVILKGADEEPCTF